MFEEQKNIILELKGLAGIVFVSDVLEKYNLTPEQTQEVFKIYYEILDQKRQLNMIAEDFSSTAGITRDTAIKIAEEIRKEVLYPVLSYLEPKHSLAEVKLKMQEVRAIGNARPQIKETADVTLPNQPNVVKPPIAQPDKPFFPHPVPQNQKSIDSAPRPLKKDAPDIIIQEKEEMELNSPAKQLGL